MRDLQDPVYLTGIGMVVAVRFLSKIRDEQFQVVEGVNILSVAVLNGNRQGGILHSGEQKPLPA